jgi:predicted DNA-binding protein
VYLPQDVDERLKELASEDGTSKNDLIREYVKIGVEQRDREAEGSKDS